MKTNRNPVIVFVCEHGAAKSILAAAYFNRFAKEIGSDLRGIARGTNPDPGLSEETVKGLAEDGLTPTETVPQRLTESDVQSAQKVIAFCDLPEKYQQQAVIERWDFIPPVSQGYEKARDVIIERIRQMLSH